MVNYHMSDDGVPRKCEAQTPESCRAGKAEGLENKHFDNSQDAQQAYEKVMNEKHGSSTGLSKKNRKTGDVPIFTKRETANSDLRTGKVPEFNKNLYSDSSNIPKEFAQYENEVIQSLNHIEYFGYKDGQYLDCGYAAVAWMKVLKNKGYSDVKVVSDIKDNAHAWLLVKGKVFDPTPYLDVDKFDKTKGHIHDENSKKWPFNNIF